jgi:hypothetical protein
MAHGGNIAAHLRLLADEFLPKDTKSLEKERVADPTRKRGQTSVSMCGIP